MTPDHINAGFEAAAAIILWLNVRRLWRDRELKGVSVVPTLLYFVWCLWNLYYYAHLGQTLSWYAGFGVGLANITWVGLALWFQKGRALLSARPDHARPMSEAKLRQCVELLNQLEGYAPSHGPVLGAADVAEYLEHLWTNQQSCDVHTVDGPATRTVP